MFRRKIKLGSLMRLHTDVKLGVMIKYNALLLAGCVLFTGCAGRTAEKNISDSAGNGDMSITENIPDETTQIPEGDREVSGTDDRAEGTGTSQEDKKPGTEGTEPSQEDKKPGTKGTEPSQEDKKPGAEGTETSQEDKKPRPETGEKRLHLDMISSIKYNIGEDKLLVYGNKGILLLDMYTLEVIKRADNEAYGNTLGITEVWEQEDGGYMINGRLHDETNPTNRKPMVMIDYDSELQPGSVLNVDELLGIDKEQSTFFYKGNYDFFDKGQKLLYKDRLQNKFYLYDFQSGGLKEIVPQRDIAVSYFVYLESVNQILFRGSDENHQNILARMDMDGKILDTNSGHYYGYMWDFQDFVLISESVPIDKEGECAVFCYDIKNGSVRSFPLVEGDKTTNFSIEMHVFPSSGGKYYVTLYRLNDKKIPYKPHIYSSEDGRLLCEMQLSNEEFGEDFYISSIYIDDEAERMVIHGFDSRTFETWIVSKDLDF